MDFEFEDKKYILPVVFEEEVLWIPKVIKEGRVKFQSGDGRSKWLKIEETGHTLEEFKSFIASQIAQKMGVKGDRIKIIFEDQTLSFKYFEI